MTNHLHLRDGTESVHPRSKMAVRLSPMTRLRYRLPAQLPCRSWRDRKKTYRKPRGHDLLSETMLKFSSKKKRHRCCRVPAPQSATAAVPPPPESDAASSLPPTPSFASSSCSPLVTLLRRKLSSKKIVLVENRRMYSKQHRNARIEHLS